MSVQKCPVCGGSGLVPHNFYDAYRPKISTGDAIDFSITCRTCSGTGVVSEPKTDYVHVQEHTKPATFTGCTGCEDKADLLAAVKAMIGVMEAGNIYNTMLPKLRMLVERTERNRRLEHERTYL